MGQTLYTKIFDRHVVREVAPGQYQLFIDLHLIHEVTTPQAFEVLKERGLPVRFPARTVATADHVVETAPGAREQGQNGAMLAELAKNTAEFGVRFYSPQQRESGIVHVLAPERGFTQPGMTIACGDSHTCTHGAFGAIAFGIGTSQVRDVLASQTLLMEKLKVRRIEVNGTLQPGVSAKDVALYIIGQLGSKGGVGYVYEFAGEVFERFTMDERMTVCNMAIEGGARSGYVNPDQTTFDYLAGREGVPSGDAWQQAVAYWQTLRSDPDAEYDDVVVFSAFDIQPTLTWGISPDQSVPIDGRVPTPGSAQEKEALDYMGLNAGRPISGVPIDVAFIGSCTNGRLSDFEAVARCLEQSGLKVAQRVKALIVPGSHAIREALIAKGLDKVFAAAGFELREPGCSMCIGMNTDKLVGDQVCASTSNRNFKGRQGSPTGRTLIMSPLMVAASAVTGAVADPRTVFANALSS
jgi:3-isopropylmalate/(R)-2-methylmalate dehydratase large subunit